MNIKKQHSNTNTNNNTNNNNKKSIKKQPNPTPTPSIVDISSQPHDKYLKILRRWRNQSHQSLIKTLNCLYEYKYRHLTQVQFIFQQLNIFHKQICKQNQKSDEDQSKVQVCEQYFQEILQLKKKLKKLEKDGSFKQEKQIKKTLQEQKNQKFNLVNNSITVPLEILNSETDLFHKKCMTDIYRAFIHYYRESHFQNNINKKLIQFLLQLYPALKKRYFYLQQKDNFLGFLDDICRKFKNQKFLINKKKMLNGQITVEDIIKKKSHVFINYELKKKQQEQMKRVLKQSQKNLVITQQKNQNNIKKSAPKSIFNYVKKDEYNKVYTSEQNDDSKSQQQQNNNSSQDKSDNPENQEFSFQGQQFNQKKQQNQNQENSIKPQLKQENNLQETKVTKSQSQNKTVRKSILQIPNSFKEQLRKILNLKLKKK